MIIEITGINTYVYKGNLSYLELVFQCAKLYLKSLSFLSLSNITQNYRVSDSQGIQR